MPFAMGYGGNNPETPEKEKAKMGKQIGEWQKPNTPIPQTFKEDPEGGAYASCDWALKTNEGHKRKKCLY